MIKSANPVTDSNIRPKVWAKAACDKHPRANSGILNRLLDFR